jgi:NAD(P)-dependent dehydrogenase (short-subunit alcohol dehydrogenase family)
VGAANRTVYCAAKHAVEGFTKALAIEVAPHGIRVNSVAPTFVETEFTRPMFADQSFRESVLSKIPAGRLGRPEDIAPAVVFLCSDAASLITGSSVKVDGGWTAQ